MVPRGEGSILLTGTTTSIRGSSGFAAFAGDKDAVRDLEPAHKVPMTR